jgi:hypothetical protein
MAAPSRGIENKASKITKVFKSMTCLAKVLVVY